MTTPLGFYVKIMDYVGNDRKDAGLRLWIYAIEHLCRTHLDTGIFYLRNQPKWRQLYNEGLSPEEAFKQLLMMNNLLEP